MAIVSRQGLRPHDLDLPQAIDIELDAAAIGFDQHEQTGDARPSLSEEIAGTRQLAQTPSDGAAAGAELHLDDALGHAVHRR